FTQNLLSDQPEPPKYFAEMKKRNKTERPLLTEVPQHKKLSKTEFLEAYRKGITVVDTRNKVNFAAGFIPGSLNIQGNNAFATWCGWFLKYDEPFILIADPVQMEDLTRKLMRIGLDNVMGYVSDVNDLGVELQKVTNLDYDSFAKAVADPEVQIVDLRNTTEFKAGQVPGSDHVFIGTLEDNLHKISRDKKVVIHCQAGDRSSIGYSVLSKHGFTNIANFPGGMAEWRKQQQTLSPSA